MKERIKKVIEHKNITAGELATLIGVQRSSISHILNGRNKPGAAFIESFLNEFQDINARWLLTGSGNMLSGKQQFTTSLFANNDLKTEESKTGKNADQVKSEPVPVYQNSKNPERPKMHKIIDQIVVFYSDKTFGEYKPE